MLAIDPSLAENIVIPIADWRDEVLREEALVEQREDVIDMVAAGVPSGKIAKRVVVSQELGVTPVRILRSNKILFYTAAQAEVASLARREKETITARNGTEYAAPRFVGPITREEEDVDGNRSYQAIAVPVEDTTGMLPGVAQEEADESANGNGGLPYADTKQDPGKVEALKRAQHYLREVVSGHMWNRLKIVYHCGGDVQEEARRLKAAVDMQVFRLLAPGTAAEE